MYRVKQQTVLAAMLLVILVSAGCQERRELTHLKTSGGKAIISCRWPCDWGLGWLAYGPGLVIAEGDRLHVSAEVGNSVLLQDQRSQVLMGPGARVVVESGSYEFEETRTRLRLDDGGAYAGIYEDLTDGFVEIETPAGTARLVWEEGGSAMLVQYDVKAQELILACLMGKVALNTWNGTTWLSEGVIVTVDGRAGERTIRAFEGASPQNTPGEDGFDPGLWEEVVKNIE